MKERRTIVWSPCTSSGVFFITNDGEFNKNKSKAILSNLALFLIPLEYSKRRLWISLLGGWQGTIYARTNDIYRFSSLIFRSILEPSQKGMAGAMCLSVVVLTHLHLVLLGSHGHRLLFLRGSENGWAICLQEKVGLQNVRVRVLYTKILKKIKKLLLFCWVSCPGSVSSSAMGNSKEIFKLGLKNYDGLMEASPFCFESFLFGLSFDINEGLKNQFRCQECPKTNAHLKAWWSGSSQFRWQRVFSSWGWISVGNEDPISVSNDRLNSRQRIRVIVWQSYWKSRNSLGREDDGSSAWDVWIIILIGLDTFQRFTTGFQFDIKPLFNESNPLTLRCTQCVVRLWGKQSGR